MKKQNFIYSIFILSLISIVIFIGCQQEESLDETSFERNFLSLSPNVDFSKLTKSDLEIISQAFFRLKLKVNEDGLYEIIPKSGKDINISDELFNYFQRVKEYSNKSILSEIYFDRKRIKTRGENDVPPTDCVAWSIAYAMGLSYEDVNSKLVSTYGDNGVPYGSFFNAINTFCNGSGIEYGGSMFYNTDILGGRYKYIIVIGVTHAVNLISKSGEQIIYYDAQNRCTGFCDFSYVTRVCRFE